MCDDAQLFEGVYREASPAQSVADVLAHLLNGLRELFNVEASDTRSHPQPGEFLSRQVKGVGRLRQLVGVSATLLNKGTKHRRSARNRKAEVANDVHRTTVLLSERLSEGGVFLLGSVEGLYLVLCQFQRLDCARGVTCYKYASAEIRHRKT